MQDTDWASRDWTYGKLLRDKTIVVTGCASGIGRDTAKLIKQLGGDVIGPLINDKQAGKVREQIEDAVAKGARVVIGGGVDGRFVEPTILTGVTPDMKVYAEETFGPVVPVIPYRTDSEAIAIANDSEYGLSSGVITRDESRGLAIAAALETGMCHVNCSSVNDEPHVPFGGSKSSGVGRHGGRWSTETFTETRWVTLERGGRGFPPVF